MPKSIPELEALIEQDWSAPTAADFERVISHYRSLAREAKGAASKKLLGRAADLVDVAFDFDLGTEFDHEDVSGTRLVDVALEVAEAAGRPRALLARLARVRDKPLSPAAQEQRAAGREVLAAAAALEAGRATDAQVERMLDALLEFEQGRFRKRDNVRRALERALVKPDPRVRKGALGRLTDALLKKARKDDDVGHYAVSLVHVLGSQGELARLREVYAAEKKHDSRAANATAERLLRAAPPELFEKVFEMPLDELLADAKDADEWQEGLLFDELYERTDALLKLWKR